MDITQLINELRRHALIEDEVPLEVRIRLEEDDREWEINSVEFNDDAAPMLLIMLGGEL